MAVPIAREVIVPQPPDKPRTHDPLDLEIVWDLSDRIDEDIPDGVLTPQRLAAVAEAEGAPAAHAYVAAGVDPDLEWKREHDVAVEICTGGCQAWGSVPILERLLALREARRDAGEPGFDVIARGCLDACDRPPVAAVDGPDGRVVRTDVEIDSVEDLPGG
ncbi:MAG: (2Fe-2S) ferredoxin domain-containing protein [Myxococcota bacterium]